MEDPRKLGHIGVLAGGPSNERQISLQSGEAVYNALKEVGADAVFLDIKKELTKEEAREFDIDIAFIALHGRFGEDGTIQRILEDLDIPYTGSGPLASRLALDKIASREIFIKNGIDVPRYKVISKTQTSLRGAPPLAGRRSNPKKEIASPRLSSGLAMTEADIGFPLVVKPQFEGSSIGVSIVKSDNELKGAIDLAFSYGSNIVIERCIKGKELTVGLLDDEPLPVIEIVVKERFYNFEAKYNRDDTQYIIPAKVSAKNYKDAQVKARLAHNILGCRAFSRVDMILDEKQDRLFVLEVNSIPGLTNHSLLPKAAASVGIGFSQLCLKIVESALVKNKNKLLMTNDKAQNSK